MMNNKFDSWINLTRNTLLYKYKPIQWKIDIIKENWNYWGNFVHNFVIVSELFMSFNLKNKVLRNY